VSFSGGIFLDGINRDTIKTVIPHERTALNPPDGSFVHLAD
jgi:hypothetical protein